MTKLASGVKLTWDDLLLFPEDGKKHELIDGEHFVTATPIRTHQLIVMNLGGLVWQYLRQHGMGQVFFVPMDVILTNHDVVEPDLLYYSHDRAKTFEESPWVKGVPNLAVEVLSPSTRKRDRTLKRRLYEKSGVDEYWLIDPNDESIEVLRLVGGTYARAAELRAEANDTLTTPLFPGLEIQLATIFAQ